MRQIYFNLIEVSWSIKRKKLFLALQRKETLSDNQSQPILCFLEKKKEKQLPFIRVDLMMVRKEGNVKYKTRQNPFRVAEITSSIINNEISF